MTQSNTRHLSTYMLIIIAGNHLGEQYSHSFKVNIKNIVKLKLHYTSSQTQCTEFQSHSHWKVSIKRQLDFSIF